jgi:NADPH:quinone reductase-like Zn-dependent oxidoreductase
MYSHLNALIRQKVVKPVLARTYPIEAAAQAQKDVIENAGAHGRLTLKL